MSAKSCNSSTSCLLASAAGFGALARDAGKVTAASAYSWFSELYNRAPYDIVADREVDDPALAIQHGRFYREYPYPDIEVVAAGGSDAVIRKQDGRGIRTEANRSAATSRVQ